MTAPTIDIIKPPRKERLSYEEYLALPDGGIVEWVEGEVLFHVPPTPDHQDVTMFLGALLRHFAHFLGMGKVLAAPIEVKLWPGGPSREPDLLFVSTGKMTQIDNRRFNGPPDLVVEIVSPASVTLDRITKFREYERAGVAEYWIIDPRPFQQQADFYVREADGLFAPAPIGEDGVYRARVMPGFRFRVPWLWQIPLPNPQRALTWMLADAPGLSDEVRAAYRQLLRVLGDEPAE